MNGATIPDVNIPRFDRSDADVPTPTLLAVERIDVAGAIQGLPMHASRTRGDSFGPFQSTHNISSYTHHEAPSGLRLRTDRDIVSRTGKDSERVPLTFVKIYTKAQDSDLWLYDGLLSVRDPQASSSSAVLNPRNRAVTPMWGVTCS